MKKKFTPAVCKKLGNYVYRLIDPRDGETFYIGKGKNNRVYQHAIDALKSANGDEGSEKISRIKDIKNCGLDVLYIIHRHNIPDNAIFHVEAALIDAFPGLSNDVGGHGSNDYGPMSPEEIFQAYALPKFPEIKNEKLIFINVNKIENRMDRDAILRQTQCAWKLNPKRANKAEFVLSVLKGVVIGVFKNTTWIHATPNDFPRLNEIRNDRYAFFGEHVEQKIWERFVGKFGKRLTDDNMRPKQNPIKYFNI